MAEPRSRSLRPVLALLMTASALLWASSRMEWVNTTTVDDLRGTRTRQLTGAVWAPELVALALVALAAVAAVVGARGWPQRVLAALLVVLGVAAAVPAVGVLSSGGAPARAGALLDSATAQITTTTAPGGVAAALAGGLALIVAGLRLLRVPAKARGLSDRYDSPAVRRQRAAADPAPESDDDLAQRRMWDALDAGRDPTADAHPGPGGQPGAEQGPAPHPAPVGDSRHGPSRVRPDPGPDRGKGGSAQ